MTMNPFFEDIVIEMSGQGPTGKTGNSIESIVKTSTDVLTDTYTITFTWGNTTTFEVENGNGIVSITKTGTDVLTDTYTVLFSNETTTTFDVVNGRGITSIAKVSTDVLQDVYEISYNDGTSSEYIVTNGRGITSIEKSGSHDNIDIYTISYNDNTVSTFQVVNGIDGTAATIAVGSTTTGLPGTDALVTNSGTSRDAVFNFVIPRGNTGNGIASIALVGTVGLTKTYRVTYTDGEHFDYQVLDGNGIASIALYSTSGLNKTYRVSYTNGDYFDYVVSDGNGISSISLLSQSGLVKTYRITYTNGTHFDFSVSDGNGIASIEKTGTSGAVDTYTVTFTDPTAEPFSYDVTNGSDEWGAIVGDIADQTDLQQALDDKAPVIVESASGDLVTFADGADLPVESLSVNVEAVQDLHGQPNPYPAGEGKNLFNPDTTENKWVETNGIITTSNTHKSATLPATEGQIFTISNSNTTYAGQGGNILLLAFFDSSDTLLSRNAIYDGTKYLTVRAPANSSYVIASFYTWSSAANQMLEIGNLSSYAPYRNYCPITGHSTATVTRTGVNLFDKTTTNVVNGYFGSAQPANIIGGINFRIVYIDCKPNTTYTIQKISSRAFTLGWSKELPSVGSVVYGSIGYITATSATFTTGADAKYLCAYVYNENIDTVTFQQILDSIQIELGSSATPYQPYQGQQITIPLGQTVYGATLDVLAGTLTVTHKSVTLDGTNIYMAYNRTPNYLLVYNQTPDIQTQSTTAGINATLMNGTCPINVGPHDPYNAKAMALSGAGNNSLYLYVIIPNCASENDAIAWMNTNPVQVVYPLSTPISVQLTANQVTTLIGYNAIWADCGAVDVRYRADSKLYVDGQISEAVTAVKRIMTTTTTEMKAPKNLTAGEIVIVGDDLYKATSNIASGATLTVGSNVVKVTLAEWVASLVA